MFLKQVPSGSSLKVVHHVAGFLRDKFDKYDYGAENMKIYGTPNPPAYNVGNIKAPVYVMYAVNDWATSLKVGISISLHFVSYISISIFALFYIYLQYITPFRFINFFSLVRLKRNLNLTH